MHVPSFNYSNQGAVTFGAPNPSLYTKAKNWLVQPMIFSWQLILIANNPGCFLQMSQIVEEH
jgi:hypothetical protein